MEGAVPQSHSNMSRNANIISTIVMVHKINVICGDGVRPSERNYMTYFGGSELNYVNLQAHQGPGGQRSPFYTGGSSWSVFHVCDFSPIESEDRVGETDELPSFDICDTLPSLCGSLRHKIGTKALFECRRNGRQLLGREVASAKCRRR